MQSVNGCAPIYEISVILSLPATGSYDNMYG